MEPLAIPVDPAGKRCEPYRHDSAPGWTSWTVDPRAIKRRELDARARAGFRQPSEAVGRGGEPAPDSVNAGENRSMTKTLASPRSLGFDADRLARIDRF